MGTENEVFSKADVEGGVCMSECYNGNRPFSNTESRQDSDSMQYFTYIHVFCSISDFFAMLASSISE